jgi:hypothetical protein
MKSQKIIKLKVAKCQHERDIIIAGEGLFITIHRNESYVNGIFIGANFRVAS